MRLIYLTDLHGSLAGLELLLELTNADMYIVAGDLLYNPYRNYADMEEFYTIQQAVRGWIKDPGAIAVPLRLRRLADSLPPEKQATIERYFQLVNKAHRAMKRQYQSLEGIAHLKRRAPVYFLPGNYDLDLSETALAGRQIHRRVFRTPLGKLGGFGGAPVFTPGVPQHLAVPFHEQPQQPGARSDPMQVLLSLDPDIAVTHTPPLGVLDGSPSRPWGSWGIREFVERSPRLKLLLCGHVHEAWGAKRLHNCWVVNSSNFGPVAEPEGYRRGNYFAEIIYDPFKGVQKIIFKRIAHSSIWHIVEYTPTSEGGIRETVIDEKRYDDWRQRPISSVQSSDLDSSDYFSLEELQLYNQIKLFLRRFETVESEHRVDDIREMVDEARKAGTEIAFDILGSVNFGQSVAGSDVDAILYIEDDPANNRYNPRFFPDLIEKVTHGRYKIEFTDIIDLWGVRDAIARGDGECEELQRFVIYRTIGRPINVRLLRRYDALLYAQDDLRRIIQTKLRNDLRVIAGTWSHSKSFDKYLHRIREAGVAVPVSIQSKVHKYLHEILGQ